MELLKKVLSVLVCFVMLAVMLGVGASGGRDTADADAIGIGVIMGEVVRVRKAPSTSAEMVATLKGGQEVTVLAEENGFYQIILKIEGGETVEGYMKESLISMKEYFNKNH